jgi:glycosyltransferase involved in cell wall biosynthesis
MYYSVIVKNVAKKACAIITITQSSKKDIEKYITNKTNIHVTLLGSNVNKVYDNNFEKLGTKFNIKTPGYILFFGNHRINKNSERVIAAYSLLVNENQSIPDLVLNIKPNKMVKRILENTKAEKKCRFIGFVDEEIKWSLFSHALFLAAPSLYEGFGLFLVEAMLTNTPIVTSKIPCLQEVAGSAAEFVDPYSVLSIAAGMKALLENDALRKRLAAEGAKQCLKYSWEKCAEETYTIYKDVLTQPIK